MDRIKISLFCGGRGSSTLIRELVKVPNVDLTLIINAYDDGLSTGLMRRTVPGLLGPSDFRKCLSYIAALYNDSQKNLVKLFEYRLDNPNDILAMRLWIVEGGYNDTKLSNLFLDINPDQAKKIRYSLIKIINYIDENNIDFDFNDCSIGNLIFAGFYLIDNSFNIALKNILSFVDVNANILNISDGQNLILSAIKEDGFFLDCEAKVVGSQSTNKIKELYFLNQKFEYHADEFDGWPDKNRLIDFLQSHSANPKLSSEAYDAILNSDILVFGPGTQHSSLYPSYLIASDVIAKSNAKAKILVTNLGPDNDIHDFTQKMQFDYALKYMHDPENSKLCVTHVLSSIESNEMSLPNGFDKDIYKGAKIIKKRFYDFSDSFRHAGGLLVEAIIDCYKFPTINQIKPTLTIFKQLNKFDSDIDFIGALNNSRIEDEFKLNKIIFVCDKENIIYDNFKDNIIYKFFSSESDAILFWLSNDDSDIAALLMGDGLYDLRDLIRAKSLLKGKIGAVCYGSRVQFRRQNLASLRSAYAEHSILFIFSLIGSYLLSFIQLLKHKVLISDPLTGFKYFERSDFNKNILGLSNMLNSRKELTAALLKSKYDIVEFPVIYITYKGFTKPWRRFKLGFSKLLKAIVS